MSVVGYPMPHWENHLPVFGILPGGETRKLPSCPLFCEKVWTQDHYVKSATCDSLADLIEEPITDSIPRR